jgi:hypothetical protein
LCNDLVYNKPMYCYDCENILQKETYVIPIKKDFYACMMNSLLGVTHMKVNFYGCE